MRSFVFSATGWLLCYRSSLCFVRSFVCIFQSMILTDVASCKGCDACAPRTAGVVSLVRSRLAFCLWTLLVVR